MILFPTPVDQFFPFLICSFFLGIVLGAIYEIFRIRRIAFKNGSVKATKIIDTVITAFEDTVFLIFAAITTIILSYKLNYGIPRWYSYGAAILGVILWRKTAGRLIIKLADKIIALIKGSIKKILGKVILPPIRFISGLIGKIALRIKNNRAKAYTKRYLKGILDSIFNE